MSKTNSAKYYGEKCVKSLWEQICDEFAAERALMENADFDDATSVATDITQYSASRHTPVVYERYVLHTPIDANVEEEFDPAVGHPAAVGLSMLTKPKLPSPPPEQPPDPNTSTPKNYLEYYVLPVLLPGLAKMLIEAKREYCFVRKTFRFNGCDFLTEYLYKHNPSKLKDQPERANTRLDDIEFVKRLRETRPRKPLPLSLRLSEDKAATKIQAFCRGHLTRSDPKIAELRQWQKDRREEKQGTRDKVQEFWDQHETMLTLVDSPEVAIKKTAALLASHEMEELEAPSPKPVSVCFLCDQQEICFEQ